MNLAARMRSNVRALTVITFVIGCLIAFGYLWVGSGGNIPVVASGGSYRVTFKGNDLKNLLDDGDVKIAGIVVGHVQSRKLEDGNADVTISLDDAAAPLHQGARIQVGVKALIGSSYVGITDGKGAAIPNHATLPASAVVPAVDVDELLSTLDAPTRAHLMSAVASLQKATTGTGASLDATMTGAGQLADQGSVVLRALAAQSVELQSVTVSARRLLDQLDTGQGQIATLVSAAQKLTSATSAKEQELRETVQALPRLLDSAQQGTASLQQLSAPLSPVAADLRAAAPDLSQALQQLPSVTSDLNGLVPSLDTTLTEAPATLSRLPAFDATLRTLVPTAQTSLSDLNPMLSYLAPYGLDLGALFGSFGGSFDQVAEDGTMPIRLTAMAEGLGTVRQIPVKLPDIVNWDNPYPKPNQVADPTPFTGSYPHVTRTAR